MRFIEISNKTNPAEVIAFNSEESLVDLGGFPRFVEGYPNTLWNPQGTLDCKREIIGDNTLTRNTIRIVLRGRGNVMKNPIIKPKLAVDTDRLSKEFNELLERYGFDNEQSADVAKIVASELGPIKESK